MFHRGHLKYALVALVLVCLLFQLPQFPDLKSLHTTTSNKEARSAIPNYVHFIFLMQDTKADFPFTFHQYLSVYAAWYYLGPERLYFHTNAQPRQIQRARDGLAGKWSRLIFEMPGLVINRVDSPTHAKNKIEINHVAHKSDFIRVPAIRDLGGLYVDFDVFVVRDMKPLRETGFEAVTGREPGGLMTSGVILAKKNSKLVNLWAEQMHQVYDQGWVTHSNILMTQIGEQLIPEPWELLVLEEAAFTPVTYAPGGIEAFLEVHDDIPSPVEKLSTGDPLPAMESSENSQVPWAMNLNKTYAVHGFRIEEVNAEVSPRSVLARRSNFGRALYPVVRDMYAMGVVTLDEH